MSDFKAKMHQIRFPLGLRPRPGWGTYSAPQTRVVFKGLLLRGGRRRGEGGKREGRESGSIGKGEGKRR